MNPAARVARVFVERYGCEPAGVASAPGRLNIIGEHIDYHGGLVLPVAIAERTAVAVGLSPGRFAAAAEDGERFPPIDAAWPPVRRGDWSDYVAGVALELGALAPGEGGVVVAVASDVPVGGGLSSSAALEVATALALARLWGLSLPADALARVAHQAETGFVGVPCGSMDQYAVALARARHGLLLDCGALTWSHVPVEVELVLADSGDRHDLRSGHYATRRKEGEAALAALQAATPGLTRLLDIPPARLAVLTAGLPDILARRVRHVVNEQQRVRLAAGAMERNDTAALGALINASHASLRDLYECSTPRLDAIAAAAVQVPRVLGARLVGAGWGGAVLVACEPGAAGPVAARLRADRTLNLPDVRTTRPGEGARLEA